MNRVHSPPHMIMYFHGKFLCTPAVTLTYYNAQFYNIIKRSYTKLHPQKLNINGVNGTGPLAEGSEGDRVSPSILIKRI